MSKQKFVVFLIAIIGMIATFLPWYEIGSLGMIMGYQTVGWSTFIMFALVFLFGLRKEVKQDMSMGLLYLGSFFSLLAAFVVLWQMITLGLDKKRGVCRLPVTCWLTTLVFYTGLTRSLLLESVCRSGLSFSVIGKEDKNAGIFFGKKFTGSR